MQRRCATGKANASECTNITTDTGAGNIRWPMAISSFKIGPELRDVIIGWRGNSSMHNPNINWDFQAGSRATYPWNNGGAMAKPGDVNPPGMPQHAPWPVSGSSLPWGAVAGYAKIAKVVPCAQ